LDFYFTRRAPPAALRSAGREAITSEQDFLDLVASVLD